MELLPCPFCGNKAEKIITLIECRKCEITINNELEWNTRHYPWISVKDRIPERLTCVIGLLKDKTQAVVCQCNWEDVCNNWHFMPSTYELHICDFDEVTHWMPLP